MKPLPYISISGAGKTPEERLQSLIEFEPVLYLLGYGDTQDKWNNISIKMKRHTTILSCHKGGEVVYVAGSYAPKQFSVLDQQAIIDYVLNYEAQ